MRKDMYPTGLSIEEAHSIYLTFASAALTGMIANSEVGAMHSKHKDTAKDAFDYARAMLYEYKLRIENGL